MTRKVFMVLVALVVVAAGTGAAGKSSSRIAHGDFASVQSNLVAIDANNIEYSDINAAKVTIWGAGFSGTGNPGWIGLWSVGIQTCRDFQTCHDLGDDANGLIQAGWIKSNGPSARAVDDCINIGTTIRGYFVEWKSTGAPPGGAYHCQYVATSAAKFGDGNFEIIEPNGTWRVLKDGKQVGADHTLNWLQGYALSRLEYVYSPGIALCPSVMQGGEDNGDPFRGYNESFFIRHTGGSYFTPSGVNFYRPTFDSANWLANFDANYAGDGGNKLIQSYIGSC